MKVCSEKQLGGPFPSSTNKFDDFRVNFRPNHNELAGVQGINLFVFLSTTTFLFVSPNSLSIEEVILI